MIPDGPDPAIRYPLSPDAEAALQRTRDELTQRNAEHGTEFYLLLSEDEAVDLAAGYVPNTVKAAVRAMLDWAEEDRRRAQRPVKKAKARRSA